MVRVYGWCIGVRVFVCGCWCSCWCEGGGVAPCVGDGVDVRAVALLL